MPRNAGGTFTLVSGNPVISGTVISSTWANNTLSDIATALTESVCVDGRTPMTGPLKQANGTAALPSYAYTSEVSSGLYLAGPGLPSVSVGGAQKVQWSAAGETLFGNLNFTGTGRRITGDLDNSIHASRVTFQSSNSNAQTSVCAAPNGSSQSAAWTAFNNSASANCAFVQARVSGTEAAIASGVIGSGTQLPLVLDVGSEAMRIDTSRRVGIGGTPSHQLDVQGTQFPQMRVKSSSAGASGGFSIEDSSGKRWTMSVGVVSATDGFFGIYEHATSINRLIVEATTGHVRPGTDNTQTLGSGPARWSVIYAGTGTINTSDARTKTDVRPFAPGELAAAKALASEIGVYQFLDMVTAKGEDTARLHIGMTVQRAIEIMTSNGLDPMRYGFICYDEWDDQFEEVADPAGDIVKPETRQKMLTQTFERHEIEIIDGKPVRVRKAGQQEVPVFEELPVTDEAGVPVLIHHPEVLDEEGNVITAAYDEPLMHPVPVMETVETRCSRKLVRAAGDLYSFRPDELYAFIARGFEARLAALEVTPP